MTRVLTKAASSALALALAAVPTLLDRCAETCAAHPATVASTPGCHHATASGTRIGHVPPRCGHDHSSGAVAAKNGAPSRASFAPAAVIESTALPVVSSVPDWPLSDRSPPGSPLALNARSLPLRI